MYKRQTQGRTYSITGNDLLSRGQAAIQDRTTAGSASYLSDLSSSTSQADSILYMLTIAYQSSSCLLYTSPPASFQTR